MPGDWNVRLPYEEKRDRKICDYHRMKYDNYFAFGGVGFYRKTFFVPKEKAGKRVVLHFGCVESDCAVWINGRKVGENRNWSQTGIGRVRGAFLDYFDLEIAYAVKFGEQNVVTVRVYDTGLPMGQGGTVPDSGGITGLVWIEYLPKDSYQQVLITAPFGTGRISAACLPARGGSGPDRVRVQIGPWDSPDYAFPGRKRSYESEVALSAPNSEGWRRFTMDVPDIEAWDLDSPNLYELRILDKEGQVMALERFGVRTIEVKGRQFLLNGKPVYFCGVNTSNSILHWSHSPSATTPDGYNYDNRSRKLLRARKAANFTSMRVHTGPNHRNAYLFCDELGLMVRDEWLPGGLRRATEEERRGQLDFEGYYDVTASFNTKGTAFQPYLEKKLKRWIRYNYNCPSVVTFSGGNEYAAGDPNLRLYGKLLLEFLRENDPQQRPFTPSSGLHWEQGDIELRRTPQPCEYLDYHSYELGNNLWPGAAAAYTREYDELVKGIYADRVIPVINGEWLWLRRNEGRFTAYTPDIFDNRDNVDVEGYVKLVNDLQARRKPYEHRRVSSEYLFKITHCGVRIGRELLDEAKANARYYHRAIELFRRDCPREAGYSIHGLHPFLMQKIEGTGRIHHEYGSPESEALAMAQQGLIAIPDFYDKHILAEQGLDCKVHVVNWSRRDFAGTLEARLERQGDGAVASVKVDVPTMKIGDTRALPLSLHIPPYDKRASRAREEDVPWTEASLRRPGDME